MTRRPPDPSASGPPEALHAVARRLHEVFGDRGPAVFLVLGSGLGALASELDGPVEIPFQEIPGFPGTGVAGHGGCFVGGYLEGRPALLQAGRYHLYEGHPPDLVVAPVRIAAGLGCPLAVFTNAVGGIDRRLSPGSIVLVDDQVNLQWRSPLAGPARLGESRFPDMTRPYDPELSGIATGAAARLGIPLHRGTYGGVLGPAYETPAEVRALGTMGASVVGMSTVPEVIAARARGMRVLTLSLVTNRAAGLGTGPLSHDDVLEAGERASTRMTELIRAIVRVAGGTTRVKAARSD